MKRGSVRQGAVVEAMESRLFLDASQLTEVVTSSTVSNVSTIQVIAGKAVVSVTNPTTALVGKLGISVYASATPLDATNGPTDSNYFLGLKVIRGFKADTTVTYTIPLAAKKATIPEGTYRLYAVATDGSAASVATTGPLLTVAEPSIHLTPTDAFSKLPVTIQAGDKTTAFDKLTIQNTGNDIASGKVTIGVFASGDGSVTGATQITTVTKALKIPAGKQVTVVVPLKSIPSSLASATYDLVTQVTDPNGANTTSTVASQLIVTDAPTPSFTATVTSAKVKDVLESTGQTSQTVTLGIAFKNTGEDAITDDHLTVTAYRSSSPTTTDNLIGSVPYTLSVAKKGVRKAVIVPASEQIPASDNGVSTDSQYIVVTIADSTGTVLQTVAFPKKVKVDV